MPTNYLVDGKYVTAEQYREHLKQQKAAQDKAIAEAAKAEAPKAESKSSK